MLGLRTALGKLQRGGEQIQGVLSTPCAEGSSWLSLSRKSPVRRESRVFSSPPCVPGTVCQRWELLPRESPRPETCLQCLDRSQARSSSWSTEKIQGLGRWTAALTRYPCYPRVHPRALRMLPESLKGVTGLRSPSGNLVATGVRMEGDFHVGMGARPLGGAEPRRDSVSAPRQYFCSSLINYDS